MRAPIIGLLVLASATSSFAGQLGVVSRSPTQASLECKGKLDEYHIYQAEGGYTNLGLIIACLRNEDHVYWIIKASVGCDNENGTDHYCYAPYNNPIELFFVSKDNNDGTITHIFSLPRYVLANDCTRINFTTEVQAPETNDSLSKTPSTAWACNLVKKINGVEAVLKSGAYPDPSHYHYGQISTVGGRDHIGLHEGSEPAISNFGSTILGTNSTDFHFQVGKYAFTDRRQDHLETMFRGYPLTAPKTNNSEPAAPRSAHIGPPDPTMSDKSTSPSEMPPQRRTITPAASSEPTSSNNAPGIPPAPGYETPTATPQDPSEAAKSRWGTEVRAHTAQLIAKAAGKRGRILVSFKVSEAGDVFNVEITGEPSDAKAAAATLRNAHMPSPPDQRDHTISVSVNIY